MSNTHLSSVQKFPIIEVADQAVFPGCEAALRLPKSLATYLLKHNPRIVLTCMPEVLMNTTTSSVVKFSNEKMIPIGVMSEIRKLAKEPTVTASSDDMTVLIKALFRVQIEDQKFLLHEDPNKPYASKVSALKIDPEVPAEKIASVAKSFMKIKNVGDQKDISTTIKRMRDEKRFHDLIFFMASYLHLSIQEKWILITSVSLKKTLSYVSAFIARDLKLSKTTKNMDSQIREDIFDQERKLYLREQMRIIKRELGELEDDEDQFVDGLKDKRFPKHIKEAIENELEKLKMSPNGTPEYMVSYNYILWLRDLPWVMPDDKISFPTFKYAADVLTKSHFGLDKVKDRILEFLAVLHHTKTVPEQILLLNGPPGVGKTSLAKSVADALNWPFVKVSLGGLRDEAEIRGHRRTYIGALPGKIIQAFKQAGTSHCVILLDEIDKIGTRENNGDVAAALLEVLDPQQNKEFQDHYIGLPFDCSKALFLCTSNDADMLSAPLLDRMVRVDLTGYTIAEKMNIAKNYLLPRILKKTGLHLKQLQFEDKNLHDIVTKYTRESGIRQLEREMESIALKRVRAKLSGIKLEKISATPLEKYLGPRRFFDEPNDATLKPGVEIGLAYTPAGGDILYVESLKFKNSDIIKSQISFTGSLGKVMQESAMLVTAYIRSHAERLGINAAQLNDHNIHIHFPDGATQKDGPSAGVTILASLVSLLKEKEVPSSYAMTGEISLRGQVLPVGGIREKILAAQRYGKNNILIPRSNQSDLMDLPKEIKDRVNISFVDTMDDALNALGLLS